MERKRAVFHLKHADVPPVGLLDEEVRVLSRGTKDNVAVKIPGLTTRVAELSLDHVEFAGARRLSVGRRKARFRSLFREHAILMMDYLLALVPIVKLVLESRTLIEKMTTLRKRQSVAKGARFDALGKEYRKVGEANDDVNDDIRSLALRMKKSAERKAVDEQLWKWKKSALKDSDPFVLAMKRFIGLWIDFAEKVGASKDVLDDKGTPLIDLNGDETEVLEAIWKALTGKNVLKGDNVWRHLEGYVECLKKYLWNHATAGLDERQACLSHAMTMGEALDNPKQTASSFSLFDQETEKEVAFDDMGEPVEVRLPGLRPKKTFIKLTKAHFELETRYLDAFGMSDRAHAFGRLTEHIEEWKEYFPDYDEDSFEAFRSAMTQHTILLHGYYRSKHSLKDEERELEQRLGDVEMFGGGEKAEEGFGVPLLRRNLNELRERKDKASQDLEGSNADDIAETSTVLINKRATARQKQLVKDAWRAHGKCIIEYLEADAALAESVAGDDGSLLKQYIETRDECRKQTVRVGRALQRLL